MCNIQDFMPEKGMIWNEYLCNKCTTERVEKYTVWYSNVNCHYIVNRITGNIQIYYGYHGKLAFEEAEKWEV